jgi:hypothetical protein
MAVEVWSLSKLRAAFANKWLLMSVHSQVIVHFARTLYNLVAFILKFALEDGKVFLFNHSYKHKVDVKKVSPEITNQLLQ